MIYLGSNQIETIKVGVSDCSIYLAETKVYPEGAHDYSNDYFTTVARGSGDISFSGSSSSNKLSYSTDDGQNWTQMTSQSESVPVNEGDRVMWKGTPTIFGRSQGMGKFMATANFNAEGNAMSLLFGDDFQGQTDLTSKNSAFRSLFQGNTTLQSAENMILPATKLAEFCYQSMFSGCTNLTTAPELPAMTLESTCYGNMLRGTSITEAPELPATTLAPSCYINMFNGCTRLTSITCLATDISASRCTTNWVSGVAPSGTFYKAAEMEDWQIDSVDGIPQGWTVKNYDDYSTQYCTTVALGDGDITLNGMNSGNTFSYSTDNGATWSTPAQVNTVPVSNGDKVMWKGTATPISGHGSYAIGNFSSTADFNAEGNIMSLLFGDNFVGQTDLTGKNWAFHYLFAQATHLISAENLKLPATTLSDYCYASMFIQCSNLTKAPQLSAMTMTEGCYFYMFNRCTSLTEAPVLPATTLGTGSYYGMFQDCTSLTTAPALPATTLASVCYANLYKGCSNITSITCLATDISAEMATEDWVDGVASTGTFTKAADMTSWQSGTSGIPSGWTVVDA